jgi:hypothetical protein
VTRTVEDGMLPLPVLDVQRTAKYIAMGGHTLRAKAQGPVKAKDGSGMWILVLVVNDIGFALRVVLCVCVCVRVHMTRAVHDGGLLCRILGR